ncbi:MAG TPA: hypothetical protein VLT32_05405 [Candidatus Sulfomarinibacteraceae bacterium]|nr:hypothetical protein [Candidatus Sulfomarinibacteraceae bacterium]
MIFHPAVIALLVSSVAITGLVLYSAGLGVTILRRWDPTSGSELQLALERRTYLVSTILTNAFGFQLVSLFLLVFTADRLHSQFVGAMCAAGTFNAHPSGYPALLLKLATFILAGLWLILNHADTRAWDYPLVRVKYAALLALAPVLLVELFIQGEFLLSLEPNVITSCCGSLFTSDAHGVAADLAGLPTRPTAIAFFVVLTATCLAGLGFLRWGRGGVPVALLGAASLVVSLAAVISFISPFVYEMPSHHCPFDVLQGSYHWIGYPLYLLLGGGTLAVMGVGVLVPFRRVPSLQRVVPRIQRRLALAGTILLALLTALTVWVVAASDLSLLGS